MLTLFPAYNRRKNNKAGTFTQGLHPIHNLVNGLAADLLAALGTMGNTHSGPQKAQIVINLRHCTYSRTGVFGSCLLVNGDSGTQSVNRIHIRLVHLTQELTGIGTEALHITALTLSINGIKGQAGFTGTGKARKYHQFISGDGKIDIFQVVFSGTSDDDLIVHKLLLHHKNLSHYYITIRPFPQVEVRTKFRFPLF